jgi:hypothetical protein
LNDGVEVEQENIALARPSLTLDQPESGKTAESATHGLFLTAREQRNANHGRPATTILVSVVRERVQYCLRRHVVQRQIK